MKLYESKTVLASELGITLTAYVLDDGSHVYDVGVAGMTICSPTDGATAQKAFNDIVATKKWAEGRIRTRPGRNAK